MHPRVQKFFERYNRLPTERDPDYLEMLAMSKYKFYPVPRYKPGKCANCGSAKDDGRQYVDFGLEVDWYGTVFLCTLCLEDIARNSGLFELQENKVAELELQITALKEQMDREENLPSNLVNAWEEFKEYYDRIHPPGDSSTSDSITSVGSDKNTTKSDRTNSTESIFTEPQQPVTKSTSSTGRSNLSSLAKLLDPNERG